MPKTNKIGFLQYEDSMPLSVLIDFLTANHCAAVISPLHEHDVWTAEECRNWRKHQERVTGLAIPADAQVIHVPTGELVESAYGGTVQQTRQVDVPQPDQRKKAHRHVYFELDYSAEIKTWLNLLAPLHVVYVEPIKSKRAYLRYLCHLDNPEKARYGVEDVISLGGVDISCVYEKTQRDADNLELRILDTITRHKVTQLTKLQRVLLEDERDIEAYREVKAHFGYWRVYMSGLYFPQAVVQLTEPKSLCVDADGVVSGNHDAA